MIKLYAFGPAFGLPDLSPFVTKTIAWLRMAELPFVVDTTGFLKAPKGKLPYIEDQGQIVADSTLLRAHLEKTYGVSLDAHLSEQSQAIHWAAERMVEEHLYWAVLHERWMVDENFAVLFSRLPGVPKLIRNPLGAALLRHGVRKSLRGHGMGRHARHDIHALARRDLATLSVLLGDRPYFGGDRVATLDATAFAFLWAALCPAFNTPLRSDVLKYPNLLPYAERVRVAYFPELASPSAGEA